jgi:hypothetical protein
MTDQSMRCPVCHGTGWVKWNSGMVPRQPDEWRGCRACDRTGNEAQRGPRLPKPTDAALATSDADGELAKALQHGIDYYSPSRNHNNETTTQRMVINPYPLMS